MRIVRAYFPDRTQGIWYDDNDQQLCCTIELPWLDNEPDKSCIPVGTYRFIAYLSPTHGNVWMAQNVPGRGNIEIHNANWAKQLLGCIGVGDAFGILEGLPAVLNSVNTLNMLRDTLPQSFDLEITHA